MCVYGIGLPFDHPIWRNLPPCRCGTEYQTQFPSVWVTDLPPARWRVVGTDLVMEVVRDEEPDPTKLLEVAP